jgi:hypothetical protein
MTIITGLTNLLIGLAYTGLGFLAIDEMRKLRSTRGVSMFGLAWTAMAFTCGPHHLAHAVHAQEGQAATTWELLAVLVSLPPGLIFIALRCEALRGKSGDRLIHGSPWWVRLIPVVSGAVVAVVVFGALIQRPNFSQESTIAKLTLPISIALIALYGQVGWYLARTQIRRSREIGGWSLSGLMLTLVFPTCALTHAAYALAGANDVHTFVIDLLAVPAAIWFLLVVRGIYLEHVDDWNKRPLVGNAVPPQRPAPWDARPEELRPAVGV